MLFISCFASLLLFASRIKASHEEEGDRVVKSVDLTPGKVCPEEESERAFIFISTVDGKLSCLNSKNGQLLWNIPSKGPLLSSSISTVKSLKDLADIQFIPSLDGNLYKWNGENLENIPLSTDFLLDQMKRLPDGSLVVGGKEVVISGIDMDSGKSCYHCSTTGCHPNEKNDQIKHRDILSLRRIQKTIKVIDPRTGHEKWNFSVGRYDMEYIEGMYNEIPMAAFCGTNYASDESNSLHFSVQEGIVTSAGSSSWRFQFNSPIAGAWTYESNSLHPINIFKHGLFEGLPEDAINTESLMYLGIHEGQMYIQRPPHRDKRNTDTFSMTSLEVIEQPNFHHWRPFISTSSSRTPAMNNKKELTELSSLDYPFDNGFILVSCNLTTADLSIPTPKKYNQDLDYAFCDHFSGNTCVYEKKENGNEETSSVPLTLRDWWKEILCLSIIIAVAINISVRVVKGKLLSSPDAELGIKEESLELLRPRASSIDIASDVIEMSTDSLASLPSEGKFESRYMVDFDHLQCLGKGGFGVVFKAKKKIDDCEYAIKRIYLPRCEDAKEKMMREVKALAALDHPGIVRYFHAWWEAPPHGWQIATDREHFLKDLLGTPSYSLSHDWLLEIHSIYGDEEEPSVAKNGYTSTNRRQKRKTTESDDPLGKRFNFDTGIEELVSNHNDFDLFSNNDVFYPDTEVVSLTNGSVSNDDSFIVFETSSQNIDTSTKSINNSINYESSVSCSTEHRRTETLTASETTKKTKIEDVLFSSRRTKSCTEKKSKRLVGKCCSRSSACLTEPPLFLYIQMQLCKQETLKDWLSERTSGIKLSNSMDIFMQIVNAVEYFHGQGMMHRDLKPANIFFSLDGLVKVGDFGLVTAITRPSKGKHKGKSFVDENHTGQVGTQLYMSPEQATGKPYSQKIDVYSLGLIFFELLCFFPTQMEHIQMIYRLKHDVLPDKLQNTAQGELVMLLTAEDPIVRPEAKDIKHHQLIKKINSRLKDELGENLGT